MKLKKENINEASYGRFLQHIDKGEPIAIVSASRSERTSQENNEKLEELKKMIILAGFGYNRVLGGYIENGIPVNEKSIIIYSPLKSKERELKNFAISVGNYFNQESILFIDTTGAVYYISTEDATLGQMTLAPLKSNPTLNVEKDDYYTILKNRKFKFPNLDDSSYIEESVGGVPNGAGGKLTANGALNIIRLYGFDCYRKLLDCYKTFK